jgi:hypothetical protein
MLLKLPTQNPLSDSSVGHVSRIQAVALHWVEREPKSETLPHIEHIVLNTKTNRLTLLREIIAVYSQNNTEPLKVLCEQTAEFLRLL